MKAASLHPVASLRPSSLNPHHSDKIETLFSKEVGVFETA